MTAGEVAQRIRTGQVTSREVTEQLLARIAEDTQVNAVVEVRREHALAAADKAERDALPPVLDYLEGVIPASGFLVDDRLTLADISVASPFVNLGYIGLAPDPKTYPRTAAYLDKILARPSFAAPLGADKMFLDAA